MALTDEDINEFIRLYKEEFGEDISLADAKTRAEGVIRLLLMLMEKSEGPEDSEK
jgi:hypothetical protein